MIDPERKISDTQKVSMNEADLSREGIQPHREMLQTVFQSDETYYLGSSSWRDPGDLAVLEDTQKVKLHPTKRKGWLNPLPNVDYNEELGNKLANWCEDNFDKAWVDLAEDELEWLDEPVRSNLHSFIVDIFYYIDIPSHRQLISPHMILLSSLRKGPVFAKALDEWRDRIIAERMNKRFMKAEPPEFEDYYRLDWVESRLGSSLLLPDDLQVGDLYRPNCLFRWTPPVLDWRGIIDVPVVTTQKGVTEFEVYTRNWFADPRKQMLKEIPLDFLQSIGNTKHREGTWSSTTRRDLAWVRQPTKIVNVPRELKECRWACIEYPESVNSVRYIEQNLAQLGELDPRYWTRHKPGTIAAKIAHAMGKKDRTAYCRDFKKEGLTKPRFIVDIIMRESSWMGPNMTKLKDFYSKWIIDSPEAICPERGHGLGMAVAATTIMQIILEEILRKRTGLRPVMSGYVNDDACLVFENEREALTWAREDQTLATELSLCYKSKATFVSTDSIVMCEMYFSKRYEHFSYKSLYDWQEMGLLRKAVNRFHARELAGNLRGNFARMSEIFNYWGFCFFPGEMRTPRPLGGWCSFIVAGVDGSWCRDRSERLLSPEEYACWQVNQFVKLKPYSWKKDLTRNNALKGVDKSFLEMKALKDESHTFERFRSSDDPFENTRCWRSYEKAARAVYKGSISTYNKKSRKVTVREIYLEQAKKAKFDIIPPKDMQVYSPYAEITVNRDLKFRHPYSSQKLHLEYLENQREGENTSFPIQFGGAADVSLSCCKKDDLSIAWVKDFKKTWEKKNPLAVRINAYVKPTLRSYILEDAGLAQKSYASYIIPQSAKGWFDPFAVAQFCDQQLKPYHSLKGVKEMIDLFEERGRWKYYGRELDPIEWIKVGSVKPVDQILLARAMRRNPELDYEKLILFLERYPGMGLTYPDLPNDPRAVQKAYSDWKDSYHAFFSRWKEQSRVELQITNLGPVIDHYDTDGGEYLDIVQDDDSSFYASDEEVEEVDLYDE